MATAQSSSPPSSSDATASSEHLKLTLGTTTENETGQSTVDWSHPPQFAIDFSPPPTGPPPPTPRLRHSTILDDLARFTSQAKGRNAKRRCLAELEEQNMPPKRSMVSRPTCTHFSMVKLYFDRREKPLHCYQCGRVPSLGFLYSCEQDKTHPQPPSQYAPPAPGAGTTSTFYKMPKKLSKSKRRPSFENTVILDMTHLSSSIYNGIRDGHYTSEQIETLINQKSHLLKVLAQVQAETAEEHRSKNGPSSKLLKEKLTQVEDENKSSKVAEKKRRASLSRSVAPCDYKICHTCRPNAREKSFMSLGEVLSGDVTPIEEWDPDTMPVIPTQLARNLGLRDPSFFVCSPTTASENPSTDASEATTPETFRPSTWSPSSQPRASASAEGFRQGLRRSLLDLVKLRFGAPSPASAPPSVTSKGSSTDSAYSSTVPTPSSEEGTDYTSLTVPTADEDSHAFTDQINFFSDWCTTEDGEFDVQKWRKLSDEVLAKAAALQLPEGLSTAKQMTTFEHNLAKESPAIMGGVCSPLTPELAMSQEAENDGDLGTMDKLELRELDEMEEKLKMLKEGSNEDLEAGLEFEKRFSGLGLRLTEEAAETNSPDVIVGTQ